MKSVKIKLAGQDCYLFFNGDAMFAFDDAFGGSNAYLEKSAGGDKDSYRTVCAAAAILAEQGELARRAMGHDKGPVPTADTLMVCCTPADILRLRQANLAAIMTGYGREVESDEPVDLVLLELEQKKTKS